MSMLTQGERLILKNQRVIMDALSALLHTPGVAGKGVDVELTKQISLTLSLLNRDAEEKLRR